MVWACLQMGSIWGASSSGACSSLISLINPVAGEQNLELARPRIRAVAKKKTPRAAAGQGPYDEVLFDELRQLRKRLADAQGVPPYIVFGDATLVQMSRDKPLDDAQLLNISGVGQSKLEKYGDEFLDTIAAHCSAGAADREVNLPG